MANERGTEGRKDPVGKKSLISDFHRLSSKANVFLQYLHCMFVFEIKFIHSFEGWTDGRISGNCPLCSPGHRPFKAAAQKVGHKKCHTFCYGD